MTQERKPGQTPGTPGDSEEKKTLSVEELTQIQYRIRYEVNRLNASIPPDKPEEDGGITLIPIQFTPEYRPFGFKVLFYANDFMDNNDDAENSGEPIYHVFPRTVRMLDEIGIPYNNLSSQTETTPPNTP